MNHIYNWSIGVAVSLELACLIPFLKDLPAFLHPQVLWAAAWKSQDFTAGSFCSPHRCPTAQPQSE